MFLQAGADTQVGAIARLGVSLGYERLRLPDALDGRGTTNVVRASLYGSHPLGLLGLSAVLSYAHGFDRTRRQTGLGLAETERDSSQWTAAAQAALPVTQGRFTIIPSAGLVFSRLSGTAFTERAALPNFAVRGDQDSRTFVSPFANVGISYVADGPQGLQWIPDLSVGYRRSGAALGSDYVLVASDATAFNGNRIRLARDTLAVGASLTAHRGRWTGAFKYRGEYSNGRRDNRVGLVLRLALD